MDYKDLTRKEKKELIGEYVFYQDVSLSPTFAQVIKDDKDCFICERLGEEERVTQFFLTLNDLRTELIIYVHSPNQLYLRNEEEI